MSPLLPLTIVLPSYNPMLGWAQNIKEIFSKIEQEIPQTQLIVVDDGSFSNEKDTLPLKLLNDFLLISYPDNRGKGYALRQGVKQAKGAFIIYTDIDFPYTHESFLKIYNSLRNEDVDMAIGTRSEEYYRHLPRARVRISKLLKWFIKTFFRIPIADTQCGLKGMNQKGKEVFLQTTINRYLFDLEFIFWGARNKLRIKAVEVELRPEIQLSKMNWRILLQEFGNFLKIFVRSI
jgi:glycosyltransferase involved in cell wall biosynthesis